MSDQFITFKLDLII
jgi:hypothetical protein